MFVKVNDNIVTNYTVSYKNKTITFTTAPTSGQKVNIITMSGNGEMILDIDSFTGDGSTLEFVTRVDWRTAINSLVTVDGEKVNYVLETTDSSYDSANKAVINFGAPADGAIINFCNLCPRHKHLVKLKQTILFKMEVQQVYLSVIL